MFWIWPSYSTYSKHYTSLLKNDLHIVYPLPTSRHGSIVAEAKSISSVDSPQ